MTLNPRAYLYSLISPGGSKTVAAQTGHVSNDVVISTALVEFLCIHRDLSRDLPACVACRCSIVRPLRTHASVGRRARLSAGSNGMDTLLAVPGSELVTVAEEQHPIPCHRCLAPHLERHTDRSSPCLFRSRVEWPAFRRSSGYVFCRGAQARLEVGKRLGEPAPARACLLCSRHRGLQRRGTLKAPPQRWSCSRDCHHLCYKHQRRSPRFRHVATGSESKSGGLRGGTPHGALPVATHPPKPRVSAPSSSSKRDCPTGRIPSLLPARKAGRRKSSFLSGILVSVRQQQGLVLDRIHYVRAIALCHGD